VNALSKILKKAQSANCHIVLPEGQDPRIIEAASIIAQQEIARVTLLGVADAVHSTAKQYEFNLKDVQVIDPADRRQREIYGQVLFDARKHKGISETEAVELVSDPIVMGACMVRSGDLDGMVAGATHPTADVVRSALQYIGMKQESQIVSSLFLMEHDLPHQAFQGTAIYADCAMVIDPDAEQLACIAIDSADNAVRLAGVNPIVALLSFSTAGSANHPNVDKVRLAGKIILDRRPDIKLMTEVQFDAAIMPQILLQKAPEIRISAPANVFIFPDLQSGNIGYKIAQRIGGVQAIGPVLQGLNKPINDLSRGCSVNDIVSLVAVTAVQASYN
jgi:phosphate acetyltransferase